jgi:hypothetical protein
MKPLSIAMRQFHRLPITPINRQCSPRHWKEAKLDERPNNEQALLWSTGPLTRPDPLIPRKILTRFYQSRMTLKLAGNN